MLQLAEEDCQCLSHLYAKMGPYEGDFYNPTLARLSCFFLFCFVLSFLEQGCIGVTFFGQVL